MTKLLQDIKREALEFAGLISDNLTKIVYNFTRVKMLKKNGKNVPTLEELENFIDSV